MLYKLKNSGTIIGYDIDNHVYPVYSFYQIVDEIKDKAVVVCVATDSSEIEQEITFNKFKKLVNVNRTGSKG